MPLKKEEEFRVNLNKKKIISIQFVSDNIHSMKFTIAHIEYGSQILFLKFILFFEVSPLLF